MWQQFAIPVTTVLCLFLVANENIRIRRWGFVVGLIGQPIWIIRNFHNQEWGMLVTSIVVTGLYLYGCRFFISKREKTRDSSILENSASKMINDQRKET